MAQRQRGPEHRVGEPHLGGKAEDQRAEQGCRPARIDEDNAAGRAVGCVGRGQPHQWRNIEEQPIGDDSSRGTTRDSDERFGRQQGQQEDGRSAGDVMPVEGPNIPDCDSVRKHRAVAIELELIEKCDDRECDGPTQARCQRSEVGTKRSSRRSARPDMSTTVHARYDTAQYENRHCGLRTFRWRKLSE